MLSLNKLTKKVKKDAEQDFPVYIVTADTTDNGDIGLNLDVFLVTQFKQQAEYLVEQMAFEQTDATITKVYLNKETDKSLGKFNL